MPLRDQLLPGHGADVGDPVLASPHLRAFTSPAAHELSNTCGAASAIESINIAAIHESWAKPAARTLLWHTPVQTPNRCRCHASRHLNTRAKKLRQSRICPQSLWSDVRDRVIAGMQQMKMGDVRDFKNFGAVIDENAFLKHSEFQAHAHATANVSPVEAPIAALDGL